MPITVQTYDEMMSKDEGALCLFYGPTGVGKTVSLLQSMPEPFFYVRSEPRETKRSMRAINSPRKMKLVDYDEFDDLMAWLSDFRNLKGSRGVIVDSLSHLMNVRLSGEVQEQAYEARDDKTKARKTLVQQVKLTEEGYGAIGGNMYRLTQILMKISTDLNMIVACTAGEDSRPKWNRELIGAPSFVGKMYSNNFPGFFDLIGRVSTMMGTKGENEGKIIYPPRVDFRSPDDSFIAKATGDMRKTVYPLNIKRILQEEKGKK